MLHHLRAACCHPRTLLVPLLHHLRAACCHPKTLLAPLLHHLRAACCHASTLLVPLLRHLRAACCHPRTLRLAWIAWWSLGLLLGCLMAMFVGSMVAQTGAVGATWAALGVLLLAPTVPFSAACYWVGGHDFYREGRQ